MGKVGRPRSGSMQFWPRVRAKRQYPSIRSYPQIKEALPLGFAGYKVGMTHLTFTDNRKNSITKGETVTWPVTIVETPSVQVIGIRFYKKGYYSLNASNDIFFDKLDKELKRKITFKKSKDKKTIENINPEEYDDIRLILATQPKLTSLSKKKPEIFEMAIGGDIVSKYNYAKENFSKSINFKDVFKEGELIDSRAVTTGKGYQGPVKRFGLAIRESKSEKTIRGPGSLGGWKGQAHMMYRIAYAGKMGYHNRTEYNKLILKISDKPEEVNAKGGFLRYGNVKNDYILVKGSIQGPSKRLIMMTKPLRPNKKKIMMEVPVIESISLRSKQGN